MLAARPALVALLTSGLLLTACSSDPAPEALDLDDQAAPAEPDDGDAVDDPAPDAEDEEQLYPPLPPLEPDPDSDITIEDQEFFLELHARLYEATQRVLVGGDADRSTLAEVLADPALSEFLATVARNREAGLTERSGDAQVQWVRVVDASNGPVVVQECRIAGTRTGTYVAETDEPVDLVPPGLAVVVQTRYELVEVDGFQYRAVAISAGSDADRCHGR